jgi:DNA-binding response OmpR family regulator
MNATLLLIEDNLDILKANKEALTMEGYFVLEATNLADGRSLFEKDCPDLIVLDLMLPDGDGISFCQEIRSIPGGNCIPIIMLTAKNEKRQIREGLDIGADDYLTKPYDLDELISRINALLRRSTRTPKTITKGNLALNLNSNRAYVDGKDINLSPHIEFSLLNIFVQEEDKLLSTEYLYNEVWGQPMLGSEKSLNNAVRNVRKKIDGCGYTISSDYGKGYVFEKA